MIPPFKEMDRAHEAHRQCVFPRARRRTRCAPSARENVSVRRYPTSFADVAKSESNTPRRGSKHHAHYRHSRLRMSPVLCQEWPCLMPPHFTAGWYSSRLRIGRTHRPRTNSGASPWSLTVFREQGIRPASLCSMDRRTVHIATWLLA